MIALKPLTKPSSPYCSDAGADYTGVISGSFTDRPLLLLCRSLCVTVRAFSERNDRSVTPVTFKG